MSPLAFGRIHDLFHERPRCSCQRLTLVTERRRTRPQHEDCGYKSRALQGPSKSTSRRCSVCVCARARMSSPDGECQQTKEVSAFLSRHVRGQCDNGALIAMDRGGWYPRMLPCCQCEPGKVGEAAEMNVI